MLWGVMKVMFAFGVCVASFPVLWSKSIPQETNLLTKMETTN